MEDHKAIFYDHRVPVVGSAVTNMTSVHEDVGSIPGCTRWVEDPVLP